MSTSFYLFTGEQASPFSAMILSAHVSRCSDGNELEQSRKITGLLPRITFLISSKLRTFLDEVSLYTSFTVNGYLVE